MRALGARSIEPLPIEEPSDGPSTAIVHRDERRRELTPRALLVGCGIGAVLAAGNVYTGLKTSFIDGGSITAALLGFTLFSTFKRLGRTPYLTLENNITQTTAASAAVMSYVVGVSGPIPALSMLGRNYPLWALAAWGIALGFVGILLAASLRRKLILVEQLPFPTGTATAEVIETIYAARQTAIHRARLLLGTAIVALVFTWFRDARPTLIPQVTLFGTTLAGISTAAFTLGISWSPLMVSTGVIMGTRNAISMLLGGAVSWTVLSPWLVGRGIVQSATFGACISWMVWPALGLLIAGSFVPLLFDWRAVGRSFRDLPSLVRRGEGRAAGGATGSSVAGGRTFPHIGLLTLVCMGAMVWIGWGALDLHPLITVATLLLAVVLANVAARTAGETDIAPIGAMGMLTQLVFGSQGAVVSLQTASIPSGAASQTAQTLWALKAGQRLDASARAQVWAQLLGALIGGLVVVPVYLVIARTYGIGTEVMPAPAAVSWKATAEAVRGGLSAMPPYGPLAGGIGFLAGVVLVWGGRSRFGRFVPSPAAMGVGFLCPAGLSAAAMMGGLAVALVRAVRPRTSEASIMAAAAGGIAGESIMGVAIAVLMAAGWL